MKNHVSHTNQNKNHLFHCQNLRKTTTNHKSCSTLFMDSMVVKNISIRVLLVTLNLPTMPQDFTPLLRCSLFGTIIRFICHQYFVYLVSKSGLCILFGTKLSVLFITGAQNIPTWNHSNTTNISYIIVMMYFFLIY